MTYYRLMSIMYPLKYRDITVSFYLKRTAAATTLIAILCSFPLFTKYLYTFDSEKETFRFCHHRNILGIGFYHFEHVLKCLIFPIVPCFTLAFLNFILIIQYHRSTKGSIAASISKEQRSGKSASILRNYFMLHFSILSIFILEQGKKNRRMIISVIRISVIFICLCSPFVWNVFRQLFMTYNSKAVNEARHSGLGAFFNYEYHIVVFVLSANNCVNFFIYLINGATWRKIFLSFLQKLICRRNL